MRLIIGFIFFGLLFYGLSIYAPEVFSTLVSWAAKVFEVVQNIFEGLRGKTHTPTPAPETPRALLQGLSGLIQ